MTRTSLLYDPALLAKAIICLLLHCGEHRLAGACSPSQSKNLNDVIEEGLRSYRQDDRVTLTFPSSPPVTDGVLRRPRLGEDVRLECYIPPGRDWRNITWLHQDRTIFEAGRIAAGIPNGQQYRLALSSPTQTLTIVNVTLQASGTVRCMDTASSTQPTIITQYTLRPSSGMPARSSSR
ncbi:uncharacterized protein LOC129589989 [Paramacrobiotus metropolitanus]|uniref:uncharacterized protein LOC129589989 n=1 Tax=Paramacrobiotus metropolitanus TaxID=2943436 RepID=UPI00244643AD|nr:uncharacterized protein LOC129589989 [Paramacrobiotus metropolitanus]